MNVIEARHVENCDIDSCEFCESLAQEEAERIAEERAEDEMADMEARYEREVDSWGPQT